MIYFLDTKWKLRQARAKLQVIFLVSLDLAGNRKLVISLPQNIPSVIFRSLIKYVTMNKFNTFETNKNDDFFRLRTVNKKSNIPKHQQLKGSAQFWPLPCCFQSTCFFCFHTELYYATSSIFYSRVWAKLFTRGASFEKNLKPRTALIGKAKKKGLHVRRCPIFPKKGSSAWFTIGVCVSVSARGPHKVVLQATVCPPLFYRNTNFVRSLLNGSIFDLLELWCLATHVFIFFMCLNICRC